MGYWLKLYTDILDDPKYFKLSKEARLGMYELLLVAKKIENGELTGQLPCIEDIAFFTRRPVEEWQKVMPELVSVGIVSDDDIPLIKNYIKRQDAIDPETRMKQYRKKRNDSVMSKETEVQRECNENATKRNNNRTNRNGETDKKQIRKETDTEEIDRVPLFEPLFVHFSEYSEIPIPNNKNSGEFMTGWFEPAEKLLDMTELDVCRANDLITKAIDKATGKFTISSPRSLIKTIAGIMAEEKRLQKQSIGKEFKAAEFLAERKQ